MSVSLLSIPLGITFAGAGTVTGLASTVPPPPTKPLPSELDIAPKYQAGYRCLSGDLPGPTAFAQLLNSHYGKHTYGINRTCAAEHGEGRALDWMVNAYTADGLELGNAITRWLSAPDSQGRAGAMARRFGINYIIWNRQMWRAYDPARGWAAYTGSSPHTDHIHISFTWDGAYKQTSWWTGKALMEVRYTGPTTTSTGTTPPMTASGYPLLKRGDVHKDVMLAQGVLGLTKDGSFGPATETTLASWQSRNGVSVTKQLDNATWTKMVSLGLVPSRTGTAASPLTAYVDTVLRRGSTGAAVVALQKALGITADGSFGPATETKVKAFQSSKGLTATGVVEKSTWLALIGGTTTTTPTTHPLSPYVNTVLRRGSTGAAVVALQKALGITADGSFGPATETKVKAYQSSKGLSPTGVVEKSTWNALMGVTTTTPTTTHPLSPYVNTVLQRGSRGEAVKALQKALGLTVDGSFGPATETKVKAYQTSKGIKATGIVERSTWEALIKGSTTTPTTPPSTALPTTELTQYKGLVLKVGATGNAVKALQAALGGIAVDGSFGAHTAGAVNAFQTSVGLPRTGVVDRATWDKLELKVHPLLPYWNTVAKRGSTGANVVALQRALRITADGSFGPGTEAAVRAAQATAKLTQTGVVATLTWQAIEKQM